MQTKVEYLGGIGETNWLADKRDLSRNYKQGYRVYDSEGVATTLVAQGVGGIGGATSLYKVPLQQKDGDFNVPKIPITLRKNFTYASAFAGIGGMTMGLKPLGGSGVMAWEYDPTAKSRQFAQEAHKLLHPQIPLKGDITALTDYIEEIPSFDLLCFTPPCQPFSTAGKRRGLEDTRGTVIFSVFELIRAKQPKTLFMENVKGLLSNDEGNTWQTILMCLHELGYVVDFKVLNSNDFYVPQNRERLYLVALRADVAAQHDVTAWEEVKGNKVEQKVKAAAQKNQIATFQFNWPQLPELDNPLRLRDVLEDSMYLDERYFISKEREQQLLSKLNLGDSDVRAVALRNANMNGRRIKENNEPSFTLTATDVGGVCQRVTSTNQYRIRRLTGVECLRLQSIPREAIQLLVENFSESRLYRFAGNGLTVNLVQAVGQELIRYLD